LICKEEEIKEEDKDTNKEDEDEDINPIAATL